MANYDFKSLSGYDFSLLARDLIQAAFGIRLESFSPGPDSGIDFRHRDSNTNLIVQSKHYAESGFSALASVLKRKERAKIDALNPTRYILVTSVPLTPLRKEEILEILDPYCLGPSDIFGREDLNSLLSEHVAIEQRHFKLWLTSEAVLQRVLQAGIFTDSEAQLDRVRTRLCRYVPNPSFERAQALLNKHGYCIIAGIPGIGKTTLAEVLLADLVDRQGFQAFRIAHDLSEIRPVKNSKRKQVFYFDDFLGRTSLDKLQKNEDQRLVEFMEEVSENSNWRFILTTREYILNSAKLRYEAFSHPSIPFQLCVINLSDYVRSIRAKILHNHIYFSDLPKAYKLALLQNRGYETILRHRNYNPRVIEHMTKAHHAKTVPPSLYLNEFTNNLEHPARIWDHAFRHQISEASRHLLLVLGTLPDEVLLSDLESAFLTFYRFRQAKFGFPTTSADWDDALRELDGSFIGTKKVGTDLVVTFHNPSIRDYIEDFLSNSDSDVLDLIYGSHFYEQYTTLWSGRHGRRYQGVNNHSEDFLREFRRHLFGPSAAIIRFVDSDGRPIGMSPRTVSNESRTKFLVSLVGELKTDAANTFLDGVVEQLEKLWTDGHADKEDLAILLGPLLERGLQYDSKAFQTAKKCLLRTADEVGDFRAAAIFATEYGNSLSPAEAEELKTKFAEFAEEYCTGWDDTDPDWLRQVGSDLEFIGEKLGVKIDHFVDPLYQTADDVENERSARSYHDDDDQGWHQSVSYADDVDQMFQILKADLDA